MREDDNNDENDKGHDEDADAYHDVHDNDDGW